MRNIGGTKRAKETITPYELERLKQCMRNKARLEALGVHTVANDFNTMIAMRRTRASKHKDPEDSETEYDPANDSSGERDKSDDDQTQSCKKTAPTKTGKKRLAPAAAQPTIRVTRSQKASGSDSAVIVHPTSLLAATVFTPPAVNNVEERTQDTAQDDDIHQQDDQVNGTTEQHTQDTAQGDDIHQQDDQVPLATEQHTQDIAQDDECAQADNEVQIEEEERCIRGQNMGKGLQKITHARRAKLPLMINEGKTRPVVPLIAAKFATESNIIVRNHLPVFKHWKEYKKRPLLLEQFMGGLKLKFDMNSNDGSVRRACDLIMKSALCQQRYNLKKKYFKPFPLHLVPKTSPVKSLDDAQWNELVEYWKNPKKMATPEENKTNRDQVKFHQATGSRSYEVHLENLGDKYKNEEPNALDLFKECHYSKKKGYAPAVQSVITELENKISESTDSQNEQPVNSLVAEFLSEQTKNSRFLQNVGLGEVQRTTRAQKLEAQLAAEKSANAELQLLVSKQREQLDVLSMKFQESEQARITDKAETNKKLELLLSRLNSA